MAKIREIIKSVEPLQVNHLTEVDMGISNSSDNNFLILRTFGSDNRKLKGKASQAIHLDAKKAQELVEILNNWIKHNTGQIATSG